MLKELKQLGFIFSVYQDGNDKNPANTNSVRRILELAKFPHKMIQSFNKETKEVGFYVQSTDNSPIQNEKLEKLIFDTCKTFKQKNFMKITPERSVTLKPISNDGIEFDLGQFISVSKEEAMKNDSWIYDEQYDDYFITKL